MTRANDLYVDRTPMYAASHSAPTTSSCRSPVVASTDTDQTTRPAISTSSPSLDTKRDRCHNDDDESMDNEDCMSDDGDYATDASQDADFDEGDEDAEDAVDLVDIFEKEFVRELASGHEDMDDDKQPNSMGSFPDEEHFVIMRPDDDQITHDEPTPIHESSPWADFDAALNELPTPIHTSCRAADDDNDDPDDDNDDDDGEYEEVKIPDIPRPPVTPPPVLRCFTQTSSPILRISPLRFGHPLPGDPPQRSFANPLQSSPKNIVDLCSVVVEPSTQEVDQGCLTPSAHVPPTTTLPCKMLSVREQRIKNFRAKNPRGKRCLDDYDQCNGWCYRDLTRNEVGPIHAQNLVERDVYSRYWRVVDRVKSWDGKIRLLYVHVHDSARRQFEETVVRAYGPLFMARPIPDDKAKSLSAKKPKKEQDESVTIMASAEAQKKATARKNIEKEAQAEAERKANQQGSKALPIEIEDSDGEDTYASGRTTNAGASAPNALVGQLPEAAAPPSEGDSQPRVWHFSVPIHAPSPTQGPPCGLGAPTSTTTDASNFTGSIFSAAWGAQVRAQEASTPAQSASPVAHSSQSPLSIAPTVRSSAKTEAQDQRQIAPRREPVGIPCPSPSEPRFDIPPPVPQRMRVPEVLLDEADVQTMQLPPEDQYTFRACPKTSESQPQPGNAVPTAPAAFEESSIQRNHHDELMKGVDHIKGQRRQIRNLPRQRPYSPPSTKPQLSMERQYIVHPDALAQQHPDMYAQPPMYGMPPQQMPHLPPLCQEFVQLRYDGQPIEERLAEVQEWRRQQAIQQQRQQAILRHQQQQQQLRRHWQQRQASQDQHQRPAIVVNINYYNGSAMASGPQMVGLRPHSENLQMGARQAMRPPPQAYHVQSDVSADPHLNGGQGEGAQFHQPQHAQQAGTYQHMEQPVPSTNGFPYDAQAPLQESAHHELRQAPSRSEPQQYHASFGNINHTSALPSHAGLRPSFAVPTATPTPGPSRTYSAASRVSSQAEFGESASVAGPSIQRGCVSPEPGSLDPYYSAPTPFVQYPAAGPSRMHVGPATPTTAPYATKLESDSPQWYTCKALGLKRKNADPHERHGRGGHGPPEGDWNL
ncbi:hypothetical protein BD626DRAFT_572961 [Schizophyllum amplum]|uniref:Uncharacterized protein n=1 Tax=Schizophyllum amplum TaxID=97359 RepID=A0A550C2X6_9AGAR|nr:hypothetical protein BD626DRAFT_572961 [Auriculariopsis ampla]